MKMSILSIKRSATRQRLLWSAAVVVALAGSSVAGVAASGASSTSAPRSVPPSTSAGTGVADVVPHVDAQALRALSRPRTEADGIPAGIAPAFSAASGANVDLSRKVETPNGDAWLVPGTSSLCLVADGGAVCVPAESAAEGGLAQEGGVEGAGPIKLSEFDSAPKEVSGVVPNGVDTVTVHLVNGTSSTLTVHENVYMGVVGGAVSEVTFTGPNGPGAASFR